VAITIPILTDFNGRGIDRGVKQFQQLEGKGAKAGFAIRKAFLPAVAVLGGMALMAKQGVQGVMEDEAAVANLEATLKSTGNAVNTTAQGFFEFANRLQDTTGESAALITQGGAMLATFKNVRNEMGKGNQIFDRATVAALDLSKKGFGSLESSNKMLGKALNDPIKGITALSRAGVTFTDQQKKTIASLVASGNTLEAQKIILKEVEDQVGGTAEAMGKTLQGQLERSKRSFEELQKSLATALIPVIEFLASVFRNLTNFMRENETITKILIAVLGGLALGVVAVNAAMKVAAATSAVMTAAQWALNAAMSANPISIVSLALVGLVSGIVIAYNKSETFRGIVNGIGSALAGVAGWINDNVIPALSLFWNTMKRAWDWISENAGPVLDALRLSLKAAFAPIFTAITAMQKLLDLLGSWRKTHIPAGVTGASIIASGGGGIPRGAAGGIVNRPTLALIGEAGPEAVVPLNRTRGNGPLGSGFGNVIINVEAGLVSTPDQIGQQIIEAIQRAQRRSGPAFMPA